MAPHRFPARRARAGASIVLALIWNAHLGHAADAEPAPDTITWQHDYGNALEQARARNQLLWIQFTGPWCPNCTRMERESFGHAAVREQASRSFVPVKLRADEHQELALGFGLSGLPATVVVAPSRQVLAVHQGYLAPGDLGQLLQAARDKHTSSSDGRRLLASSGKEPAARSSTETATTDRGPRPKTETQVALSGYCPVSLISDKRLVQGQTEYTVTHEGRLYRFANLLTFNLFRGDPARYVPVNDGNCPVSQVDRGRQQAGNPRYGVLFQGRLYLCSTNEDRKRFLDEPARYATVDVADRGNCPHCLASEGIQVPGDPRYDLKHDGRRYWFPDASHREAFLVGLKELKTRR